MSKDVSSNDSDEKKILETAQARFELVEEAEAQNRKLMLEDLEFASGDQWPGTVKADRDRDGRPCLVINKIPQFIQQVTNDQRQNRPSIKVYPIDDNADVETAKVIQGIVRHIEYNSNAEVAYDTAFEGAVTSGRGFFRIITDYVSPKSFDQEILIKRIKNPFSVFLDPFSSEPDGSDASYAFIVENLSKEEYKERYPNSKLAVTGEWEATGNAAPDWMPDGSARIAEYFYKESKDDTIVLLNTGESVLKSQLPETLPDGLEIVKERATKIPTICWVKMNACEILEKTEWPGNYIPIVPVYGNDLDVNGVRILSGVVRNAKDPAKMYNYWASAETEAIALAPRAPFIIAEGQIEGYENEWETANRRNHSVLKYRPTSLNGTPVPPPQRNAFEPAVQAITQARQLASDDLKSTTGIYDAALGANGQETSGVAIARRNLQSQTSNFHFIDNLTRSLRHTGRILIDLIPKIYDTARAARIIAEDGEQKIVPVNQMHLDENGKPILYALDAGKYDVTVDVGPSFQTKRQEAVASMLEMTRSVPQVMQVAGDLLVKNMDWPGAQEIAERIKKTLPPNITDDGKGPEQLPPQVQQQMQQMGQMIDELTKHLHQTQDILDQKRFEITSREKIEFAKIEADLQKALLVAESKESIELLKQEVASTKHQIEMFQGMFSQLSQPSQFQPQYADGGQSADQQMGSQPTGGQSPGQPMEGITHVDPSQL